MSFKPLFNLVIVSILVTGAYLFVASVITPETPEEIEFIVDKVPPAAEPAPTPPPPPPPTVKPTAPPASVPKPPPPPPKTAPPPAVVGSTAVPATAGSTGTSSPASTTIAISISTISTPPPSGGGGSESSTPPPPAPVVQSEGGATYSEHLQYYGITSSTENEMRTELDMEGPTDPVTGEKHDAYTLWYIQWNYTSEQTPAGCGVTGVTVHTDVTTTLPEWQSASSGSIATQNKWNAYLVALTTHEKGHENIALEGAQKIFTNLAALNTYPTCAELDTAAELVGQIGLNKIKIDNALYEIQTNYGATQGAIFP